MQVGLYPTAPHGGRGQFGKLCGCYFIQGAVRTDFIVVDQLALDDFFGMVEVTPLMFIEAFVTNAFIGAFYIGVLIGFSWFDEVCLMPFSYAHGSRAIPANSGPLSVSNDLGLLRRSTS